ncbi:MAG TPA: hypothetical protein DCG30_00955 [Ruminococcus sp.]|nr:hypothetical protein [Ruminococcus sp.]
MIYFSLKYVSVADFCIKIFFYAFKLVSTYLLYDNYMLSEVRKLYLFCLSYAGGSANIYNKWKKKSEFVDVIPIELAGHGSRMREKLSSDFDVIVNDVYERICTEIKKNNIGKYAIYGHSMGCWITFEVAKRLFAEKDMPDPLRLFFSGNCTPECRDYDVCVDKMSDSSFRQMIIDYGGVPQTVIEHPEILDFFMPVIKSDYCALASYNHRYEPFCFDCDISVMNGIDDEFDEKKVNEWRKYAGRKFRIRNFNDGHFFINSLNDEVFDSVCHDLKESISEEVNYA